MLILIIVIISVIGIMLVSIHCICCDLCYSLVDTVQIIGPTSVVSLSCI